MGKINTKRMIGFYEELDVIRFKYGPGLNSRLCQELEEYESENQMFMFTKRSYEDAAENLDLVYGEKEKTNDSIKLLDLILNKIIGQYINIDGMERLFSLSYIDFEWEMHLSADYKMHNMKFYRDHFIHQIRDAYMAHQLLSEYGFEECVRSVLENESISKISRYVQKCLSQQKRRPKDNLRRRIERLDKDFYMRNLIYMSVYMAALFHDIGYPEAHHLSSSERIVEYIAGLYNISDATESFHKVFALLQNSLLFRLVPFEEIREKISSKRDHGAISSVVFLLNFYENGAIFRLPPYKSAAVELAGLAIYNHTNVYSLLKPDKKKWDAGRPCFVANPIAYLLRLSDDLQEWDRTYFLVSNGSNILYCNRCHTPLIGTRVPNKDGIWESSYVCNCKGAVRKCLDTAEKNTCFAQAFDGKYKFSYRRIYNVTVCDEVEVTKEGSEWNGVERKRLLISLKYDSYKLLHAAFAHPTYAKYRIKELNELKLMLEMQDVMPYVYLDYFVTSNPVHIKVRIIEDYLKKKDLDGRFKDWSGKKEADIQMRKKKVMRYLLPYVDTFCLHENFCRGCSYCSNVVDAIPLMNYLDGGNAAEFSARQHEWDIKCFTRLIMGGQKMSSEKLKRRIERDSRYKEWKKDKEQKRLRIPNYENIFQKYRDKEINLFYDGETTEYKKVREELAKKCPANILYDYVKYALDFYVELYICQKISCYQNMKLKKERDPYLDQYLVDRERHFVKKYTQYEELDCLIEDCFLQFQRMYADIAEWDYYPDAYYHQFENMKKEKNEKGEEKDVEIPYYYTAALRYVSADRYVPYLDRKMSVDSQNEPEKKQEYIDAYTDLYFFKLLKEEMDKDEKDKDNQK